MPSTIAEFGGKYLMWSSIVDAPVTYLMTEQELTHYIEMTNGEQGLKALPLRMERVRIHGTSSMMESKQDLLKWNRAGANESHIATEEEMVKRWSVPEGIEEDAGQSDQGGEGKTEAI